MGNLTPCDALYGYLSAPNNEVSNLGKRNSATSLLAKTGEGILKSNSGRVSLGIEDRGLKFSTLKEIAAIDVNSERVGEHLKDEFVKPATARWACSYSEYVASKDTNSVGHINIFVSHSWFYSFGHLVSAIEAFEELRTGPTFYFVDYFCINQHQPMADLERLADLIGVCETLLVLSPWNAPIPLTRCWCIYEVLHTILQKRKLHIVLPPDQNALFVHGIMHDFQASARSLTCLNVANAEATKESDKKDILDSVKRSLPGGFADVNSLLIRRLRQWLSDALIELGESRSKLKLLLTDKSSLVLFYCNAGLWISKANRGSGNEDHPEIRAKDSLRLWDLGLSMAKRVGIHNDHNYVLSMKYNKACLLENMGDLTKAIALMEQVVERRRALLKSDHPNLIISVLRLLQIKRKSALIAGDTEEADRFEAESIKIELLSMDSMVKHKPLTANTSAVKMFRLGRYRDAERYQRLILESYSVHRDTTYWVFFGNLGVYIFHQRGREAEGEKYVRKAVEQISVRGEQEGGRCLYRIRSRLGQCLLLQGRYTEAQEELEIALALQKKYDPGHLNNRESSEWLNEVKMANGTYTGKVAIMQ